MDWPLGAVSRLWHAAACELRVSVSFALGRKSRVLRLQGYIHCWPHGKAAVPLSEKSMPNDPGFCSGSVPFACRLFPRQPGYVITVCALAIEIADSKARNTLRAYIMILALLRGGGLRRNCLSQRARRAGRKDDAPSRADRPDYAGSWRMRRIPVKRSAHTRKFMKITGTGETERGAYTGSLKTWVSVGLMRMLHD